MRTAREYVRGLWYSLLMMGIPVRNPTFLFGDNKSVLWIVTVPDLMLKWSEGYIKSEDTISDILTKAVPAGESRKRKVKAVLYDIYE